MGNPVLKQQLSQHAGALGGQPTQETRLWPLHVPTAVLEHEQHEEHHMHAHILSAFF